MRSQFLSIGIRSERVVPRPLLLLSTLVLAMWIPVLPAASPGEAAPTPSAGELTSRAGVALRRGDLTNAIALATSAIAADSKGFRPWAIRGRAQSLLKKPMAAIGDFAEAIKRDISTADVFQWRGEDYFRI